MAKATSIDPIQGRPQPAPCELASEAAAGRAGLNGTQERGVDLILVIEPALAHEIREQSFDAIESSKDWFAATQRLIMTRSRKCGDRTNESRVQALPSSAHRPRPSGRASCASRGPVVGGVVRLWLNRYDWRLGQSIVITTDYALLMLSSGPVATVTCLHL